MLHKISTTFFGTHDFAVTILQGLIDSPLFEIELVITQPDRPIGRKQELQKSPVKILSEKHNLKIDQPTSLKNYQSPITNHKLSIVAQYGLLIPPNIVSAPKHGTINIHTSLLPKYRGASPIQSALINGETKTGVSIMRMNVGLDSGPILIQKELNIAPDDTYLDLDKKLANMGLHALLETIPDYIVGKLKPTPQDESQATLCSKLSRKDGRVDWQKSTLEIYNQYRGLTPWPGVWTVWNDRRLKLLKISPAEKNILTGRVEINYDRLHIGTGDRSIEISKLQLEGKKVMNVKEFVNGFKNIDREEL